MMAIVEYEDTSIDVGFIILRVRVKEESNMQPSDLTICKTDY